MKSTEDWIRIAKGGHHYPAIVGRKHWYSLTTTVLSEEKWEFDDDEQLDAIRHLGRSKSKEALEFLRHFYVTQRGKECHEDSVCGQGSGDCHAYSVRLHSEILLFPNATGGLVKRMEQVLAIETINSGYSDAQIESSLERLKANEPHRTILEAIDSLSKSIETESMA